MEPRADWKIFDLLFEQMVLSQQKKLLECAQRIIPTATPDDILQPNDFSELENHPYFRYEEGFLAGLQSAQMAFRATVNESLSESVCVLNLAEK